jgi:hypothetical protein
MGQRASTTSTVLSTTCFSVSRASQAEDVKNLLASGVTDEQVAAWFDVQGIPKTVDKIKAWSDSVEAIQPYQNPEQREWFASECARLGLDPVKSRLCDYLDTDDRVSFAK